MPNISTSLPSNKSLAWTGVPLFIWHFIDPFIAKAIVFFLERPLIVNFQLSYFVQHLLTQKFTDPQTSLSHLFPSDICLFINFSSIALPSIVPPFDCTQIFIHSIIITIQPFLMSLFQNPQVRNHGYAINLSSPHLIRLFNGVNFSFIAIQQLFCVFVALAIFTNFIYFSLSIQLSCSVYPPLHDNFDQFSYYMHVLYSPMSAILLSNCLNFLSLHLHIHLPLSVVNFPILNFLTLYTHFRSNSSISKSHTSYHLITLLLFINCSLSSLQLLLSQPQIVLFVYEDFQFLSLNSYFDFQGTVEMIQDRYQQQSEYQCMAKVADIFKSLYGMHSYLLSISVPPSVNHCTV